MWKFLFGESVSTLNYKYYQVTSSVKTFSNSYFRSRYRTKEYPPKSVSIWGVLTQIVVWKGFVVNRQLSIIYTCFNELHKSDEGTEKVPLQSFKKWTTNKSSLQLTKVAQNSRAAFQKTFQQNTANAYPHSRPPCRFRTLRRPRPPRVLMFMSDDDLTNEFIINNPLRPLFFGNSDSPRGERFLEKYVI